MEMLLELCCYCNLRSQAGLIRRNSVATHMVVSGQKSCYSTYMSERVCRVRRPLRRNGYKM